MSYFPPWFWDRYVSKFNSRLWIRVTKVIAAVSALAGHEFTAVQMRELFSSKAERDEDCYARSHREDPPTFDLQHTLMKRNRRSVSPCALDQGYRERTRTSDKATVVPKRSPLCRTGTLLREVGDHVSTTYSFNATIQPCAEIAALVGDSGVNVGIHDSR